MNQLHFNDFLADTEAIFFITKEANFFELATKSIQQSKHIFINNATNLTKETTKSLFKLSLEAKTNIQIKKTHLFSHLFQTYNKYIDNPKLIEINRKNKVNTNNNNLNLISDIGIISNSINSGIRKINTLSIPSTTEINSFFISFEFNNKSIATITTNSLSDKNDVAINIFQPNKNISLKYSQNTCEISNVNERKKHKESLIKNYKKTEILELINFDVNCKNIEQNNISSNINEQNIILTFLEVNSRIN
jgi:hypothetical protein